MAQGLAHSVGMAPYDTRGNEVSSDDGDDNNDGGGICEGKWMEDNDWFYHRSNTQEINLKRVELVTKQSTIPAAIVVRTVNIRSCIEKTHP